mgnify:CR=1 FL=1
MKYFWLERLHQKSNTNCDKRQECLNRNEILKFVLFINYRKTWSARLLVSGNVTSKIAVSPSPEVLGPIQPLLQPQSDLPSEDWEKWRTCKKMFFILIQCVRVNKKEWIKRNKEVWFSTSSFSNPSSKCAITHRYLSQWSGRLNSVQKIAAPSKKCLKVHYLIFSVSFCPHLKIFHTFFGHRMDKTQKCWLTFCGFLANFIL